MKKLILSAVILLVGVCAFVACNKADDSKASGSLVGTKWKQENITIVFSSGTESEWLMVHSGFPATTVHSYTYANGEGEFQGTIFQLNPATKVKFKIDGDKMTMTITDPTDGTSDNLEFTKQ